ncbi:hypothetical protein B0A55_06645 [Friedmanniomyces simplex]|uniref:Uncharacterized protein n=1 Tax=Friedmanniomyces simplex TaxID=329884 RepID=A0A4U0X9Y0_9PEZI|nr:hypothetical protein B0A55_06645 [Friedmanniomyces simplex]
MNMNTQSNMNTGATTGGPAGQKEDYLDKGLDALEKKSGTQTGHTMDPNQMRSTNEKITDKARGMFEKATGKHVPDKVSN